MAVATKRYRLHAGRIKSAAVTSSNGYTVGDGWVEGWISPEVIDRSGEYVPVSEWDTTEHETNPVAFVNHNRQGPVVGRWSHPDGRYAIEKRSGGLWGRCYFNLAIPEGQSEYESYKGKFKRAFSPGFVAMKPERGHVNGKPASILRKAKLLEVSLVGIPDNQNALAVYCKSIPDSGGNKSTDIPPGYVKRYGAYRMPTETETTVVTPKGHAAYFEKALGILSVVKDAKDVLLAELPEGEDRNKAYGLMAPVRTFLKDLCAYGRDKEPAGKWDEHEKAIDALLEGFPDAEPEGEPMDEAALKSFVDARIQEKIAEPVERINTLQTVVESHEAALSDVLDSVESVVAN